MIPELRSLSPTAIENVYHFGHVVPDLRSAMDAFGRRLQITWSTPFQMESGFDRADGEPDSDEVRIALSAEGPPFLELIEVVPDLGSIFAEPAGRWPPPRRLLRRTLARRGRSAHQRRHGARAVGPRRRLRPRCRPRHPLRGRELQGP